MKRGPRASCSDSTRRASSWSGDHSSRVRERRHSTAMVRYRSSGNGTEAVPSWRAPLPMPKGRRVSETPAMAYSAPSQFMAWVTEREIVSISR